MNAGAAAAQSDVFWFVHADVQVPPKCIEAIGAALSSENVVGGVFRIRIPKNEFVYPVTDEFAHYLGLLLRMRCGDHGLFCRRSAFVAAGGFKEVPLMEDAEFCRALLRLGEMRVVPARLQVSARRYEQIGPLRLTLAYGFIGALYGFRVPLPTLASLYAGLCQPKQ